MVDEAAGDPKEPSTAATRVKGFFSIRLCCRLNGVHDYMECGPFFLTGLLLLTSDLVSVLEENMSLVGQEEEEKPKPQMRGRSQKTGKRTAGKTPRELLQLSL